MPRNEYKTTKPYARRLKQLSGRILNQRYEGHNLMPAINRAISQIEKTLDYIDQRATMHRERAKKRKEKERELLKQAEQERIEDTAGDSTQGSITTLAAGDIDRSGVGSSSGSVGAEGGGNEGISVRSGAGFSNTTDLGAEELQGKKG